MIFRAEARTHGIKAKFSQISDVLHTPKTVDVTGEFNDALVKSVTSDLEKVMESGQGIVPVVINSYGGFVHSLNAIIDRLQCVERSGVRIVTVVNGKAMSCGAFLFMSGKERFVTPGSRIMIHRTFGVGWGNPDQIKTSQKENEELERLAFESADVSIGRKKGWLLKQLAKRKDDDWYMGTDEALSLGIATAIGSPYLNIDLEAKLTLRID